MHRCSTDEEPQHQWCPPGADSWCKWQLVEAGARASYTHKPAIPKPVFEVGLSNPSTSSWQIESC